MGPNCKAVSMQLFAYSPNALCDWHDQSNSLAFQLISFST